MHIRIYTVLCFVAKLALIGCLHQHSVHWQTGQCSVHIIRLSNELVIVAECRLVHDLVCYSKHI